MWKWTCSSTPNLVWEHHSWHSLNAALTAHEDGVKIPGFREFPPCEEIHNYWDDGVPCSEPKCKKPYIRDDEPVE